MLQARRLQVQLLRISLQSLVYVILQLHCGPGVYSASNRYEYQKMPLRIKEQPACEADSQLSGKCEIFDISQPHRPPLPVTGIAQGKFLPVT
jgi:hypothetical protein